MKFETFQRFTDVELANAFGEKLNEYNIPYEIIKEPQLLDGGIIGTSSFPDIVLKIRAADFSKANEYLGSYFKEGIENVDKDYYLFEFKDFELYEILAKPDEWGHFDYQLAQKILTDRGHPVDNATLERFKEKRIDTLKQPEGASIVFYILAYIFIFTGIIYCISPIIDIESLVFCTPLVSFLIGRHIFRNTRTLMNGQVVFSYLPADRKHGNFIMYLGLAIFLITAFKFLLWFIRLNN